MTLEQCRQQLSNPNWDTTLMDEIAIDLLEQAAKLGNHKAIDQLIDRLAGVREEAHRQSDAPLVKIVNLPGINPEDI